jgi:predicted O-methyltransferase YrrM
MVVIVDEFRQVICNQNPYVEASHADSGYPHTHLTESVIRSVFDKVNPSFWLELGTMLGGSALKVADVAAKDGREIGIICVDPFCGDVNMWIWEAELAASGKWRFLGLVNGRPSIYERFLANVLQAGYQDSVLPIQTTSVVGLRLIERLFAEGRISQLPEVIYLDSAHEAGETLIELELAWAVLADGGALCGDDFDWSAVANDVSLFASRIGIQVDLREGNQWILWKRTVVG